ncbi:HTH-type transcriptional regulator BetI [Defluviimonas aquaemixtae]|uniref:HTH-type transcriptional regulator BetI n=1 Tax=Albidovulum aquaemixtae TaxID=1542388 RepID=A0A2R8BL80_9RHOB|nr:TetR family transcriptional regulator C-terminal domain-containing protein [Defluviimonas aquaemixtae]SPH24114.1 HTH-type transcriptional regulator BetI [Defluviimonas aquaemixtae]
MSATRRKFTRDDPESRRAALISATLRLMAGAGPQAATVRAIADEAGVSPGMIRHHFDTKDDLVNAAYGAHMAAQMEATEAAAGTGGSARARLARFVTASLMPPVVDPRTLSLWAAFIHMIRRDPAMRATHAESYLGYRDRLEQLIADALAEAGRTGDATRPLAIASNAVIDGLWLEAGALPEAFAPGEVTRVGLDSVGAILALDLGADEEAT